MNRSAVRRLGGRGGEHSVEKEPINLLVKNDIQPEGSAFERLAWTQGLLRVMESVHASGHEARPGDLYTEYGRRIHHGAAQLGYCSGAFGPVITKAPMRDDGLAMWDAFVTLTFTR